VIFLRYEAVIFDLDGVIADTAKFHYEAWKKIAEELGIYFDEKINESLKGVSRMESLEILLKQSEKEYSQEQKNYFASKKNDYFKSMIQKITPGDILPGSIELIKTLKRYNVKLAVASASRNANTVLENLGIKSEFDYIVDAAKIVNVKPDPEIFLAAAENLGVEPKKCVGIEDSVAGIEAIKRAGMFAIGIGDPTILKKADMVLEDLRYTQKIVKLVIGE